MTGKNKYVVLTSLEQNDRAFKLEDNIFNSWYFFEDLYGCARWALDRPCSQTKDFPEKYIEHFTFKTEDCLKDIENYILKKNETIIVCGEIAFTLSKEDKIIFEEEEDDIYFSDWKKVSSQKELKKYLKELSEKRPILAFHIEDNILPQAIEKYLKRLEEHEKYLARKVYFKGDIVITDPCYIVNSKDFDEDPKKELFFTYKKKEEYPDFDGKNSKMFMEDELRYKKAKELWENEDSEEFYEPTIFLGFKHESMERYNLYGDWSCTTYNVKTKEILGEFCADSGTVCVYNVEDVKRYNPDFLKEAQEKPWIATIIKDFEGYVQFEILNKDDLIVHGIGNIEFKTAQTGF